MQRPLDLEIQNYLSAGGWHLAGAGVAGARARGRQQAPTPASANASKRQRQGQPLYRGAGTSGISNVHEARSAVSIAAAHRLATILSNVTSRRGARRMQRFRPAPPGPRRRPAPAASARPPSPRCPAGAAAPPRLRPPGTAPSPAPA